MAQSRRSFEECVAAVDAAGKIGKQRALEMLAEVNNRAEAMQQTGVPDRYLRAASDLADEARDAAQRGRRAAMQNAVKRAGIMQRAETEAQGRVAPHVGANLNPLQTKLTLADGLHSILHYLPGASRHDSVDGLWGALTRGFISPIGNRLRQLGLDKLAQVDGLRGEVAEAWWRLNGGTPRADIAVSKNAQQIAEAFFRPMELLKERLNAAGAHIGDATDYVTHTLWDRRQLEAAAGPGVVDPEAHYQAWKARDVPRMAEKTFDKLLPREGETPAQAKERFLRSLYEATKSGVHMRGTNMAGFDAMGDYIPPAYEGTVNLAKQVSHQRVVYWKDAQSWADHMREFGGGQSLYYNVVRTLDTGARRLALMEYLGDNAQGNFETVARRLIEKNRNSPELDRLKGQIEGARNVLGRLTGELNMPVHRDAAELVSNLMSFEAATHLGGVGWTHLVAAPMTISSEMVQHGVSRLESLANVARALTMNRGPAEAQEALADAGAYMHGYTNAIQRAGTMGEVWQRDGFPGMVSWLSAHFMNLTGLPRLIDSFHARGVRGVLMDRLGRQIDRDLAEVEPHQQAALRAYGIGPDEWSLLRSSSQPSTVEGKRWVTPSDAVNSDMGQAEALLRSRGQLGANAAPATISAAVQKAQWELGDKLLMYINDAADRATVRPGVREQAIMLQKTRPGDPMYFVARALGQFKMWPLAASVQILGRDIARSLSNKEMATNIGAVIALSALGGAARMALNDLATGRPQRDYTDPRTLLAALAQGGGLGIYGDFLFGETNRMGGGIVSTLGGPIAGDAEKLVNMFTRWRADMGTEPGKAMQHLWPDLAHFAVNHVPFGNLIYLKGTLDYLLWYHLYEAASPGWWERTNRRLQKEQGRTMVGYRPGGAIPYSPFGLGAR